MSTPDPERAMEQDADKLEERIDHLDESIDDAKQKESEREAKDPGGFDDPEAEEEEEE